MSAKFWDTSIYFKISLFALLCTVFFARQYIVFILLFVYASYIFIYFRSLNFNYIRYYQINIFTLSKILITLILFSIFLSFITSNSINLYLELSEYRVQINNYNEKLNINELLVFYDIYLFLVIYLLFAIFLDILMPIITFIFTYVSIKISHIIEFLFLLIMSQKYAKKNIKNLNILILIVSDLTNDDYRYILLSLIKELFNKIKLTAKEYQIFENELAENIYAAISNNSTNKVNIFLLNNLTNWSLYIFKYIIKFDIVILNNNPHSNLLNKVNVITKILKKKHLILSNHTNVIEKLRNLKIKHKKINSILISKYENSKYQSNKQERTIFYYIKENRLNIKVKEFELNLELDEKIQIYSDNNLLINISSIIGIVDFLKLNIKESELEEILNKFLQNNQNKILLNEKWSFRFGNNNRIIVKSKIPKVKTRDILSCIEYMRKSLGTKNIILVYIWSSEKLMIKFINSTIISKVDAVITNKYELFLQLNKTNANKNKQIYYVSTLNEALFILLGLDLSNTGVILNNNINNKFIEKIV